MLEQLVTALREQYELVVDRAERIDFGIWEESFSVWTDQGRFYAKRFLRTDRKQENMLRGLKLSETLRARGFPAPRIIPARTGSLIASSGGERYQVTEWVQGQTYHPGDMPLACAAPMGALLGTFHRMCGSGRPPGPYTYKPRDTALSECRQLADRYRQHAEHFAVVAREVLADQIALLESLPADVHNRLPRPLHFGPCFHSFWVEQILFNPDGQVAALVDWTDGAGKEGFWVADMDTGIHLSALQAEAIQEFSAGYQSENPLPESEWLALSKVLVYGHLASTNFLGGWFERPYRRMRDWEETAELWHRLVPERFARGDEIEDAMLRGVRSSRK